MISFKRSALILSLLSPLALAACGEGWDMQTYNNRGAYTAERTAGSGVEYVRAGIMRAKGPVLEPQMEDRIEVQQTNTIEQDPPPPPAEKVVEEAKEAPAVQEADKIFTTKQKK